MTGYVIAVGRHDHLADATLVALIDNQLSDSREARDHLSGCAKCTERLNELTAASRILSTSLPEVRIPQLGMPQPRVTARRRIGIPAAIAASFLIVATAAAASTSFRHWVSRQFAAPEAAAPPPEVRVPAPAPKTGMSVSFAPTDSQLVIQVDHSQDAGTMEISISSSDRISARVAGDSAVAELMILPGRLRIANTKLSSSDYRISVPTSIRVIRVAIAGRETAVMVNDGRLDRRIPLR